MPPAPRGAGPGGPSRPTGSRRWPGAGGSRPPSRRRSPSSPGASTSRRPASAAGLAVGWTPSRRPGPGNLRRRPAPTVTQSRPPASDVRPAGWWRPGSDSDAAPARACRSDSVPGDIRVPARRRAAAAWAPGPGPQAWGSPRPRESPPRPAGRTSVTRAINLT
jgi:hypothetical protein